MPVTLSIVLSAIVACTVATPGYLGGYVAAPAVAYTAPAINAYAAAVPVAVSSKYQAQDIFGQYSYGYNDLLSTKSEARAADGSVAGAYSYVDGKGEVQKVQYKADSNGFHVDATNLPVGPVSGPEPVQDTPEVMEARAKHLSTFEEVKNRKVEVATPFFAPVVNTVKNVAYTAPIAYSAPAVTGYAYTAPAVKSVAYTAPVAYSAPAVTGYAYTAPAVKSVAYTAPIAYSAPAVTGYAYTAPAINSVAYTAPIAYSAPAVKSVAYTAPIAYSAPAVTGYAYTAPAYTAPLVKSVAYTAPAVAYAAPVSVSNQYHSQDSLGQYTYGYNSGLSAKAETKTFDGVTRGGYSYVDANGIVQKVDYTADPIQGFRVAGTNLPVGPNPVAASTIPETAEVIAAKTNHFRAHVEAKERLAKAL